MDVPVIVDADTGYSNAVNVVRTVHDYEQAGVSAIHLEDQTAPKRCGHLEGKDLVPAGEHAGRIRVAVAARTDPDFVIIARTDALARDGVDAACDRALRYADAGAAVPPGRAGIAGLRRHRRVTRRRPNDVSGTRGRRRGPGRG